MKLARLLLTACVAAPLCSYSPPSLASDPPTTQAAPTITWTHTPESALTEPQLQLKSRAINARNEMFGKLLTALTTALTSSTNQPDPATAISVCKQQAPAIAQSISQDRHLRIGRTSDKLRNPANTPPPWAAPLLADKPAEPRFTAGSDGSLGVILPIKLAATCLVCHGAPDQITPTTAAALASAYPADQATGYKEGDLRGWFWVEVPPHTPASPQ
jgi:hypothetical protein